MKIVGQLNVADIGKFRKLADAKLHQKIQNVTNSVQDDWETLKDYDRSRLDLNSEDGVVLVGPIKGTDYKEGFLDQHVGEMSLCKQSEGGWTISDVGSGVWTKTTNVVKTDGDDETVWGYSTKETHNHPGVEDLSSRIEVRLNKAAQTLTLLEESWGKNQEQH